MKKYSIIIRYAHNPGFLIRIALLLERRGYRIQSLEITEGKEDAIMELSMVGHASKSEQVIKQIQKLVDVISVVHCTESIEVVTTTEKVVV